MRESDLCWREGRQTVISTTENHDSEIPVMLQLLGSVGGQVDQNFGSVSCVFAS